MQHFVGVQEAHNVTRAHSLDCEGQKVTSKPIMILEEALKSSWGCDAHYFQYHLSIPEEIPSLAKSALPFLRQVGVDLLMDVVSIDIDTNPHTEITEIGLSRLLSHLQRLFETPIIAGLPEPNFFYTTRGGARLIWKLQESIPVDEAERHIKGLVTLLKEHFPKDLGFTVDDKAWDWTRVFRLPMVLRDNKRTEEHPCFTLLESDETLLNLRSMPISIVHPGSVHSVIPVPIAGEKPSPEEVRELLYMGDSSRKYTSWHKEAKKRLRGRDCFEYIWEGATWGEGTRDSGIQQAVGQAVGLLHHLPIASPQKIYALFYQPVSFLIPDLQTEDWTEILWAAVCKYWGKEDARKLEDELKQQQNHVTKQDKLASIVQGMKEWCDHSDLSHPTEEIRRAFALNHLIVSDAYTYHIMQPNGYYHPIGTNRPLEVPALVKRYNMDDLIELTKEGDQNLPFTSIFSRHGTKVSARPEGRLENKGYHIRDIDGSNATLMITLYKRNEEVFDDPQFSEEIDHWLRCLVAPVDYPTLESWIAHALAFDEGPIAALSIGGPPGIGKQLFIQGLAECLNTEEFATAREFGRFREKLLHTPFLIVNEGLPRGQEGVEDIADIFRHFVSGDPLHIEVKGQSPITVFNPLRIIFTANNREVIQELAGHRSLTRDDQEALLQRLIHIRALGSAASYLLSLGGRAYTGQKCHWVGGPEGDSDYVVAKHFAWIYKYKRHFYPRGGRFLVEGNMHSEYMDLMRTELGLAPAVIEALIMLLESPYNTGIRGLSIEEGHVFVTNNEVYRKVKETYPGLANRQKDINKTLSGLMTHHEPKSCRKYNIHSVGILAWWKELDVALLYQEAIKCGLPHSNLKKLCDQQMFESANMAKEELRIRYQ